MKLKLLAGILSVAMGMVLLSGCSGDDSTKEAASDKTSETETKSQDGETFHFEIVSKGFQHQYWQAVMKGAEEKSKELNVTINFIGPNSESDIADQVQMLNNAVSKKPVAIALAALDTNACLDGIKSAQKAGIPIIGFDSGVPDAPEDAVIANVSTDNYKAGALAAEKTYEAVEDRILNTNNAIRIGVLSQDATGESLVNRGLGFIDRFAELIVVNGKSVKVEGNTKFVSDSKIEETENADVVIEVLVPATVDAALSATDCATLLNKEDTVAVFGSNQHSGEAMVTANNNLNKFGTGEDKVIGVAFDSGKVIKEAVENEIFLGAITQAPVAMGEKIIEVLIEVAKGNTVTDVDTGSQWYTSENIEDPEIGQNLYD